MNYLSTIGIRGKNGTVKAVKCGWNGDIYYDGQVLINCWYEESSVRILIGLGDLISLGPNINETVSKARDLNVTWAHSAPQNFEDDKTWRRRMKTQGCKCFYLYADNTWIAIDEHGKQHNDLEDFIA